MCRQLIGAQGNPGQMVTVGFLHLDNLKKRGGSKKKLGNAGATGVWKSEGSRDGRSLGCVLVAFFFSLSCDVAVVMAVPRLL